MECASAGPASDGIEPSGPAGGAFIFSPHLESSNSSKQPDCPCPQRRVFIRIFAWYNAWHNLEAMAASTISSRPDDLLELARVQFAPLSEAEEKLLRAAPQGEIACCGPNRKDFDPANDPRKANTWGTERCVRAALIRWLCVDHAARESIDPRGIQIYGAKIEGELDLSFVAVPFPLSLCCCGLQEETKLRFLQIPTVSFSGSWVRSLQAESAVVKGTLSLSNGFRAEGEVNLVGAQIGSNLDCGAGTFKHAAGKTLRADRVNVQGSVFLRNGFLAEGEVRLLGAQIGGNLECNVGTFKNASGKALSADRMVVQGSVFLRDGFIAEGEVRLLGSKIGGNLECNAGQFKNPGGLALNADRIDVQGNVLLSSGFVAEGEVNLPGAQIGNNLACDAGAFKNPGGRALNGDGVNVCGFVYLRSGFAAEGEVNLLSAQVGDNLECDGGSFRNAGGKALNADRITVLGNVLLRNGFGAEGEVRFANAVIKGTLVWTGVREPSRVLLNLRSATAGAIQDEKASWPSQGKLDLDGFVYSHIASGMTDAKNRLAWLELQQPFTPQPYRQLAKVLSDAGVERGSLRVLYKMEDRLWQEEHSVSRLLLRWPLSLVVGYGYYPLRALLGLLILVAIGWGVYAGAAAHKAMTPKEEKAYAYFKQNGTPPSHYEPFSPVVFSLENSLPLVKLGQTDYWQPDPSPNFHPTAAPVGNAPQAAGPSANRDGKWSLLFVFLRLQVLLGWILATLFIAGVTGIVQKD
jgi:hypothetical protein